MYVTHMPGRIVACETLTVPSKNNISAGRDGLFSRVKFSSGEIIVAVLVRNEENVGIGFLGQNHSQLMITLVQGDVPVDTGNGDVHIFSFYRLFDLLVKAFRIGFLLNDTGGAHEQFVDLFG